MKKTLALVAVIGLAGCGDFVDEDGNTSIRQMARGLQSLGDRLGELGEAIERDADIEAVPWEDLLAVLPDRVGDARARDVEGDDATDRNGAGLSIAHRKFEVDGHEAFVGVADLGALRSGAGLALRWVAPLFTDERVDGDIEEIEVEGYPGIRIRDDDGDVFVAAIVDGRFAVVAGADRRVGSDFVREALEEFDYRQLHRWEDYGRR